MFTKARTLESTESVSLSDCHSELSSSEVSLEEEDEDLLDKDSELEDENGPSSSTLAKKTSSPGLTTIVGGGPIGFITIDGGCWTGAKVSKKNLKMWLTWKLLCVISFAPLSHKPSEQRHD